MKVDTFKIDFTGERFVKRKAASNTYYKKGWVNRSVANLFCWNLSFNCVGTKF